MNKSIKYSLLLFFSILGISALVYGCNDFLGALFVFIFLSITTVPLSWFVSRQTKSLRLKSMASPALTFAVFIALTILATSQFMEPATEWWYFANGGVQQIFAPGELQDDLGDYQFKARIEKLMKHYPHTDDPLNSRLDGTLIPASAIIDSKWHSLCFSEDFSKGLGIFTPTLRMTELVFTTNGKDKSKQIIIRIPRSQFLLQRSYLAAILNDPSLGNAPNINLSPQKHGLIGQCISYDSAIFIQKNKKYDTYVLFMTDDYEGDASE